MKIKIKHRKQVLWLESDIDNFIVHRGFKKTGEKDGKEIQKRIDASYYSMIENAIYGLLKKGMHKSDATTLEAMYAEIRELKQKILDKIYA